MSFEPMARYSNPPRVFRLYVARCRCRTIDAMPAPLFVHLTWTTYRRFPMIREREAAFLSRFLPAEAQRHKAQVIALGMVQDHVHMVLRLPVVCDIPRLVQGLKGASARLANRDAPPSATGLRWAEGYNLRSISPGNVRAAVAYVRAQARRHPERAIPTTSSRPEGRARRPVGDPS
jgi:putative transposase